MIQKSAGPDVHAAGSVLGRRTGGLWTGKRKALQVKAKRMAVRVDLVYLIAGFLLGRAVLLSTLTPFILPFFATVFWLNRPKKWSVSAAAIAGALTVTVGQAFYALMALLLFFISWKILQRYAKEKSDKGLPVLVFAVGFSTRLILQTAFTLNLVWSDLLMAAAEASMAFLIMLIFMQSVPLLSTKISRKLYKNEEMICFIILLSSLLAGTIGWTTLGLSIDHVLARYAVLIFASAGGAAIGSTVGVVIGLIVGMSSVASLYQMSLLAFSGVLGGLMKEAGKIGTSAGLIIATLLIAIYGGGYTTLQKETMDSLAAVLLFLVTPKGLIRRLAFFIPGTREYQEEQQQYIRRLRDATVGRVEQFAGLFQTLAKSFSPAAASSPQADHRFLENVYDKACRNCYKQDYCWVRHAAETQQLMTRIRTESAGGKKKWSAGLRRDWQEHCVRSERTGELITKEQGIEELRAKMEKQFRESRKLVADQLHGVSQVMCDFAGEIKRERGLHDWQEEIILKKLSSAGLPVESVEIYGLDNGAVDIEMLLRRDDYQTCEKVIAPMLSGILNETIIVDKREADRSGGGRCRAVFVSAKAYEVETGAATAARGGDFVSGDNFSLFHVGSGKFALAISDGMGNGARASAESRDTLQLLTKVLKSGIHETMAIKSINSILSLRSTEEIFATLDLALIDLQNAKSKFLKIGSNPSFIRRGYQVFMLDAGNLPIGMLDDLDVEVRTEQLKSGDLLIMMSDGMFDAQKAIENNELWVKRKIKELQTENPQEIADLLLEEVIRVAGGKINDDLTVIVARIRHHLPKWSSIPTESDLARVMLRKAQADR
jgi:stage II sporulation protein E